MALVNGKAAPVAAGTASDKIHISLGKDNAAIDADQAHQRLMMASVGRLISDIERAEHDEKATQLRLLEALEATGLSSSVCRGVFAAASSWAKARAVHAVGLVAALGAEESARRAAAGLAEHGGDA